MRNLKKVLSLALALVMLVGMMVVGAGATSFKDDASIKNQEAVDVVSGLEVLLGDETGNFNPQGNLTRAQAATVIAKLDLGASFGSLAATNASSFSDVAANYWGKPYIDYCAARGLILGVGGGRYDPEASVTGVQFALMVCRVLGYEDANENITGANWETAAAALARKAGLTNNVALSSQPMTRDDMAQVAFNALQADMVEYDGRAITLPGGITIPAGKAEARTNNGVAQYDTTATVSTGATLQLCEEKFPNLKLDTSDNDAFGRPASTWTYNREDLFTKAKSATFTFTEETSGTAMANTLRNYTITSVTPKVNGKNDTLISDKDDIDELTGNGVLVEIYANDSRAITDIFVTKTALAQISRINTTAKTVSLTEVSNAAIGSFAAVGESNSCYAALSSMDEGDYVLVTAAWNDTNYTVQTVAEPKTVTGTVSRVNTSAGNLVLDGTTYNFAAVQQDVDTRAVSATVESMLYLDAYGYAIYGTGTASTTTVDAIYVTYAYEGVNANGKICNMMQGVLPDGTVVTGEFKGASITGLPKEVNEAYTYTMDGDVYNITAAASDGTEIGARDLGSAGFEIKATDIRMPSASTLTNFYADNVQFVYVSGTDDNRTVTVRNGVQDVTVASSNAGKCFAVLSKDGNNNIVASTIFVYGDAATSSKNFIYISAAQAGAAYNTTKLSDDGKTTLYGWDAYVNGVKTSVFFTSSTKNANFTEGFHTYSVNDTTRAYTLSAALSSGNVVYTATKVDNVTRVNGQYYVDLNGAVTSDSFVATNAAVVDLMNDPATITGLAALRNAVADYGAVNVRLSYDPDAKTITAIYVTGATAKSHAATVSFVTGQASGNNTATATVAGGTKPTATVIVSSVAAGTPGTGTITVGLYAGTATGAAANNDKVEFTLTPAAGATMALKSAVTGVAYDNTNKKVTLTHTSGAWPSAVLVVTAEDGTTKTEYTITVKSSDTRLGALTNAAVLSITGGTVTDAQAAAALNGDTVEVTVTKGPSTDTAVANTWKVTLTLTPLVDDGIIYTGGYDATKTTGNSAIINITTDATDWTLDANKVTVVAEDGTHVTYNVTCSTAS